MKNLEKIFDYNLVQKQALKQKLKTEVGWIFYVRPKINLREFNNQLKKNSISATFRQNEKGFVYGITFVDHKNGTVMNGSELGKEYSAKAILEKCGLDQNLKLIQKIDLYNSDDNSSRENDSNEEKQTQNLNESQEQKESLSKELGRQLERTLDELLRASQMNDYIPYHLREKQQKKLRQRRGHHL